MSDSTAHSNNSLASSTAGRNRWLPLLGGMRAASLLLLFSQLMLFASSCSSIDCPVQNTVAVYYGVKTYDADGTLKTDTLKDTLWIWSRRNDGKDTLLNSLVGKTSFGLPTSYQHPEDTLIFFIADTFHVWTLDTVWVQKNDIPHFESVDCSAHYFHELTAVRNTHNGIDTIILNNPSVTYDQGVTNFNIIFKPRPRNEIENENEDENDNENGNGNENDEKTEE